MLVLNFIKNQTSTLFTSLKYLGLNLMTHISLAMDQEEQQHQPQRDLAKEIPRPLLFKRRLTILLV